MKVTIPVNHQLNKVGDEFLDEEYFHIEMDIDFNDTYVVCEIAGMTDLYIEKSDLKRILLLLEN